MNSSLDIERFAAQLIDGERTGDDLRDIAADDAERVIRALLETPVGRRWLRRSSLLETELADRLVAHSADFSRRQYDASLGAVVELASLKALIEHAVALAAGAGAPALWERLVAHPEIAHSVVEAVAHSDDERALEATATHLLLDPTEAYGLTDERRHEIAATLLASRGEAARAIAVEYLATTAPATLSAHSDRFVRDDMARVRGCAWLAAFRIDRSTATEAAAELLGDETIGVEIRRSALNAAGESLPTDRMVDLLSYFVVHPNEALALDAARLLHRHHRHPEIAIAATSSPHPEVREIANRLMDPYRGSPAAGGSRPGDPLRVDPLLQLLRQLEEEETDE